MTTKRRKYTADFKREAVQLWQTSGKTAAEIEQELGISAGLLGRWKRKLRREGSTDFEQNTTLSAEQKRIRQLERELRIAKMERDILKKAVAIFTPPNE